MFDLQSYSFMNTTEEDDFLTPHDTFLPDLLSKINPAGGRLTFFASNHPGDKGFNSFCITIDCEPFAYRDPFYGEMEAQPREIYFQVEEIDQLNLTRLNDLQGWSQSTPDNRWPCGDLSNSLHLVLLDCQLGAIADGSIGCRITFFMTNSESYGYMTGEMDDHAAFTKTISCRLPVVCLFEDVAGLGRDQIGAVLSPEEFDVAHAEISTVGFKHRDCKGDRYRVKLKFKTWLG